MSLDPSTPINNSFLCISYPLYAGYDVETNYLKIDHYATAQECLDNSYGFDTGMEVFIVPSVGSCTEPYLSPGTCPSFVLNKTSGEPDMTLLIDYLLLFALVFAAIVGIGHGMKR